MINTESKTIKGIICDFIKTNSGIDSIDYDEDYFVCGIVNSLFLIEIMTFIEKKYGIKITLSDLDVNNFNTINRTASFITGKLK